MNQGPRPVARGSYAPAARNRVTTPEWWLEYPFSLMASASLWPTFNRLRQSSANEGIEDKTSGTEAGFTT